MKNPGKGNIPEAAQRALEQAGIDVATIACFDKSGEMQILKASGVNEEQKTFPIQTTAIEDITAISVVRYKGSNCATIMVGGLPYSFCW
ncbi:MAG: hypothetical protein OEX11_03705 [Nitrosomonas sp.]|nr:hypothetical protein [Nitrosomonas sp.]